MDQAQNFVVAPDNGIKFAFTRSLGQVARVFLKRPVTGLRLGIGDALPTAQILNGGIDSVARQTSRFQNAGRGRIPLGENREEDVLGGDVFVLQAVGFLVG